MTDPDISLSKLLDACTANDRETARTALYDLLTSVISGRTLPKDPRASAYRSVLPIKMAGRPS